jgi:predicted Na+-dependent transporter
MEKDKHSPRQVSKQDWKHADMYDQFAAAAEQLQWLTLSRNARFVDVTINLLGLAAGLLLAGLLRRRSAAK